MTTIDVDFSGAIKNQDTWFAQGHLDQDGQLQLERVHPVRREDLYDLMLEIPVPAVPRWISPSACPEISCRTYCGGEATEGNQRWSAEAERVTVNRTNS